MSSDRPLIGISVSLVATDRGHKLELATRYAQAVLEAGGIPVALAPVGGPGDVERLVERLDGLLFSGGDDFDTARLGLGPVHPSATPVPAEKQDFDFELARVALASRLPVLGICYGMQLLGLAHGAKIHQHLPDDRPGTREHRGGTVHAVELVGGSKIAELVGKSELDVISRHHQALASVEAPWRVGGRDDQGLIEAIEHPGLPFALGVQWHPELAEPGSPHARLFRGLVSAAALRAARNAHGRRAETRGTGA